MLCQSFSYEYRDNLGGVGFFCSISILRTTNHNISISIVYYTTLALHFYLVVFRFFGKLSLWRTIRKKPFPFLAWYEEA